MKQLINRWLVLLCCFTLLGTGACSNDDTEPASKEPVPPTLTAQNIPEAGFNFLYSAQTPQTFTLSVDAPWEITKTAGWFVVSPKQGEAGEQILITVTGDYNDGEARTGEFTIRANSGNNLHPCLTEKTVSLSQDAYLQAGILVEGTEDDALAFQAEDSEPVTLYITASYDWTLKTSDKSWVAVSPESGKAGERTAITVSPTPNTAFEKHTSTVTITAVDPIYPENIAEKEISLIQFQPTDKHAAGYVFLSDDFNWITANWIAPYTRYGWPGVNIDGTNSNEFALSTEGMAQAVAARGYTCSPSVYARYEGHVKLGRTANMGSITTPALSGIDADKAATLLVQFDAAAYSSAGGVIDDGGDTFYLSVTPPATIGGLTETELGIAVKNVWSWTRYSALVYGATSDTKITFGSERSVKCRLYLDNISISRAADEDAETPAPEAVETPLDKEIVNTTPASLFNAEGQIIGDGGTLTCSVRVNKAWTAESDSEWLSITTVKCGATGTGTNNGASLTNGIASVTATGLPYNNTQVEVAKNTLTQPRTGHIQIKVDGSVIETLTVIQEAGPGANFEITELTGNALELGYDQNSAAAEMKFKVKGTHAWTAALPENAWFTVTPASGAGETETEVTVKATASNTGIRRFAAFTLDMAPAGLDPVTETITVSQQTAAPGSVKWDMAAPVQWAFSAADMPKYAPDFAAKAAAADAPNALPAEQGPGYISYTHTYAGLPENCERLVGGTGHPYITGAWPGDYWLFFVPVQQLSAGTKVHFKALTRTSGTGQLYWKMEYNDGGTWKPVSALLTETIQDASGNALEVNFTHKVKSSNITVDVTVTYANALSDANIEFRMTCMANWRADGKGVLPEPNTGTFRWAGAGAADSPMIEIVQ